MGSYLLARRIFLSLLGVVFGIAFASLWVQAQGLFGSGGILPGCARLDFADGKLGAAARLQVPTLFWLHCSDAAIHAVCAAGFGLSLLLIAGFAPSLVCALLWLLYLSLSSVAGVFLSFQWDVLLLETAFLAVFLAPRQLWPRQAWSSRVPRSVLWLLRWLLFRLFFLSGVVKLLSGDPTWRSLDALDYHYFTQPLPAWTSWYAHHLPEGFHTVSVALMFCIELALPFAIFGPRRLRQVACSGFLGLLVLIGLTGNYGFFNLLGAVLCLLLLDDATLRRLTPPRWRGRLPQTEEGSLGPPGRGAPTAFAALATAVVCLTVLASLGGLGWRDLPRPLQLAFEAVRPLRSFNQYGLFARMTTERPEITLEGSRDGVEWRPYGFRWKPGALDRAPRFVQPHMPRLDWQMWFAALRRCEPWFQGFMLRLLEGAPAVRALLAVDPFPEEPPRILRSTVRRYRFAPPGSDAWWQSEPTARPYCPAVTLRAGRLERVQLP